MYDHEKFEELCKEKGLDNIVNDLIEYGIALKEDFHTVKKIKADIERKTNDLKIRLNYLLIRINERREIHDNIRTGM